MRSRIILLVLFVTIIFCIESKTVFAMHTGFTTDRMETDEQQIFLSNMNLSLLTEEPAKNEICRFDVKENGCVVVGMHAPMDSTKKMVLVYAADGTFQFGYAFHCSGSFGVEWDGNNILLYFVRSDVAALFDPEGKPIELKKIQNTTDNTAYWNRSVFSVQKTVDGNQYAMRNTMGLFNIFATSYSQLVRTDAEGNVTVLYDAGDHYRMHFFVLWAAVVLFAVAVAVGLIKYWLKRKKREQF